ncbi:MAG: aspartate kinase, partial [Sphingomonadales bacterium]
MEIIVKKFGGTSVSDLDHIQNAALRVKEAFDDGVRPVVVVSAMAGVTDQLLGGLNVKALGADLHENDV